MRIGNKYNPFYNSSGYPDPTAYAAIKSTISTPTKEEPTMDISKGDIYELETLRPNSADYFVVIAVFDSYVSGLMLVSTKPQEHCVSVRARSMMYTDAGRLTYAFKNRLGGFVRSMTEAELSGLTAYIKRVLGFDTEAKTELPDTAEAEPEPVKEVRVKVNVRAEAELEDDGDDGEETTQDEGIVEALDCGPDLAQAIQLDHYEKQLVRVETELKVYKSLYNSLLSGLTGIKEAAL